MLLFGGQFHSTNNTNELNIYDFASNSWSNLNFKAAEIPPIDSHNAFVVDNDMIVFGGFFGGKVGKYSN